jgi:hypothetical protein
MSWRGHMEALLCAIFLLAILFTIAIKTLAPVIAADRVVAADSVVIAVELNNSSKAKTSPAGDARRFSTFEFQAPWDKGSFWDDEAPGYDLYPLGRAHGACANAI